MSLNYDIQQGMASGSIGYTMPDESSPFNGMGINLNFDRYGMTSTAQYNGINLASMGPAGFSMQEIDWAMLNINDAQDRQKFNKDKTYLEDLNKKLSVGDKPYIDLTKVSDKDIENLANNERSKEHLIASKTETPESLKDLNPNEIAAKLDALQQKQNTENTAAGAAATGSLAFLMLGYLGLGRKENEGEVALDSEDGIIDTPWDQKLTGLEIDDKIKDVLDGKLKIEREILFDDGSRYVKLTDGTLISASNYLSYMNRHTDAKIILANDPNSRNTSESQVTNPSYNPNSKLNQLMDSLKNKSKAEVKEYFRSLSAKELNSLVLDGKNLPGKLKDTKLTVEKTSSIPFRDREIDPAKITSYEKINDKLDRFIGKEFHEIKLKQNDSNYDASFGDYQKTMANSESLKYISNSLENLGSIDTPLRKQIEASRDSLLRISESMSSGAINTFLGSMKPTADQLIAASKVMEEYKKDKTKKIDSNTAKLIAQQLVLDPDFAAMAQPQKLKDSYTKLMDSKVAAEKGFAEAIQKFQNKELTQAQLTAKLNKLESNYNNALKTHQDNWKVYRDDVAKMIQNRDADGKITVPSLDKISVGIVADGPVKYKDVTARYRVYEDAAGNKKLIANGEAALLERATQRNEFAKAMEKIPSTIKIDPVSGHLTTGLDGKPLTMKPEDGERRKAAVEAIKTSLGSEFDPEKNPSFAKLEAIGNFRFDDVTKNYATTVNGIDFQFGGAHKVSPEVSMIKADGANWMKFSEIAKETDISSIGLSSVLREDGSSHKGGYSFDVSYIKDQNGKTSIIKYNDDFKDGVIPEPKSPLDQFLDRISNEPSNKFSYNPYYMVDGNGNRTPNFFTAVGEKNWVLTDDWDGLGNDRRKEFSKLMRDMASNYDPPYSLTDDNLKQMWNHRHHLHVTEINK